MYIPFGAGLAFLSTWICIAAACADDQSRPNILFIAVDDLRPELGCYGQPVISPNIDRLATRGTVFERAYVQVALCMPSRVSLLTGRRPDTTGVVDFSVRFRDVSPEVVTLPQHFKNSGYRSLAYGKIFHRDDPASWSEPLWKSNRAEYQSKHGRQVLQWIDEEYRKLTYVWDLGDGITKTKRPGGLPWEAPDVPDSALREGHMTDAVIAKLSEPTTQPFFLAVGYHKPHLPFVAPRRFFDLYDQGKIETASNPHPPLDAPRFATYNWNDLRHYYGVPDVGPVTDEQARDLKHAYYACVSYVDAQIGRLLEALDRQGLRENTIVVLWGDHGWQLGEHGMWDKHSNYETSTRAPLIVSVPGQESNRSRALVEFVDIYPSLCELAGLPQVAGLEGSSFVPLIQDPDRVWKSAAFSQYRRVIPGFGKIARGMGYSMRTTRYRFTEWRVPGTEFRAYELYDHRHDPHENVNLAGHSENSGLLPKLKTQLAAGWQAALPPKVK
jgi:arylsulfatase A-like enzyme